MSDQKICGSNQIHTDVSYIFKPTLEAVIYEISFI